MALIGLCLGGGGLRRLSCPPLPSDVQYALMAMGYVNPHPCVFLLKVGKLSRCAYLDWCCRQWLVRY